MNEHNIYQALKLYNDVKAVRSGKIKKRVERRVLGKIFGRTIARLVK